VSERDLAPGTVLLDKYRVDEQLGAGGMGRVVRASHLYLQQSVAIKVLLPQMVDSAPTVARFLREAQAAVRLKSEHTARVLDVGTLPDGRPYMVMEYLEGNDLNQVLRHHGPQEPAIVCDLMLQACEGLAEAHAIGIVHRDIKPSNFFITRRPDGSMLLKILDFGISKAPINYDDNLTQTHSVIGTPSYMAPEQMKSGRDADARSDIWSMGIVMYQLLHGRPPFAGASYAELAIQVAQEPPTPIHVPLSPGFGAAILRCLEKHPNRRHQNVGELARMLAPYSSDPHTASHIANRATRILQTRAAQPTIERGALPGQQSLPIGSNGGLSTPIPLSPAALSPRAWPPSPSSTGGRGEIGRSQLTQRTGGNRGWLIAGAMSLSILAATGGFIASNVMKDDPPASPAPATSPTPASLTAPTVATAPPPAPTSPTVPTKMGSATIEPPAPTAPMVPTKTESSTIDPATTAPAATAKAAVEANTGPIGDAKTETAIDGTETTSDTKAAATAPTSTTNSDVKPTTTRTVTANTETKPATKIETKPATKIGTKPATKIETKPATKTRTKQTIETRSTTKPATKPTTKTGMKPKTETKSTTKPATKPTTTETKSTTRPATKKSTDLFNSRH
jgi:serine/threonine protein kinase